MMMKTKAGFKEIGDMRRLKFKLQKLSSFKILTEATGQEMGLKKY